MLHTIAFLLLQYRHEALGQTQSEHCSRSTMNLELFISAMPDIQDKAPVVSVVG
jgi:hypothetical protein